MADIFISYSKVDRELCARLAAYFEGEGYTVWWDTSLKAGDEFGDAIVDELNRSRAVVVIWTPSSIKSNWVRSEAGRALAEGKLIPVRVPEIDYKLIPPPFDIFHTELVHDEQLVGHAVAAQLSKPQRAPSFLYLFFATLRYQFLTWFGIVGAAITLFSGLKAILELSAWARWLVGSWTQLMLTFWRAAAQLIGVDLPPIIASILSFTVFVLSMTIGSRRGLPPAGAYSNSRSKSQHKAYLWAALSIVPFSIAPSFALIAPSILVFLVLGMFRRTPIRHLLVIAIGYFASVLVLLIIPLSSSADVPQPQLIEVFLFLGVVIGIAPIFMMTLGEPRRLAKQLWAAIGLMIIVIFLNEFSKLGLDLVAPEVSR
jgi:hypothetical protein